MSMLSSELNTNSVTSYNTSIKMHQIPLLLYNLEGYLFQETFAVDNLKSKNQTFISVTHKTDRDTAELFYNFDNNGVLGLGFSVYKKYLTFVENLKAQGQINKEIFSLYLSNNQDNEIESSLIFGGYDEAIYGSGDKKTLQVISSTGN